MQVEELKNEGLAREYQVTIPADELDKRTDAKLAEYAKTIRIPGFRPGKVPIKIMRQKYGKAVLGEILETAVNDTSVKVIEDKGVKPALQPKIEVKEFDEGKDLVFSMALEILPDFEVADYKGIEVDKPVAKVSDKEIDEALERIAGQRKSSEPVEGDRATKNGDIVVIDFKGRTADDNYEHPGMAAEGHHLELGGGQFIPGFEEQLTGKKKGETVEVKVTFPDEYQKDLAGREAIFDVTIQEIRKVVDAKIDDQLATDLGMDSLDALKEAVREQLQQQYEQHSRMKVKRALLDTLDDRNKFDVPQGMLDMEYDSIVKQVEMEQHNHDHDHDHDHEHGPDHDHGSKLSDEEKEELKDIAARRVRLGLVLSKIGGENNIMVNDQELQRAVIQEAQRYPGQERAVFDYFSQNRQALERLRAPLFEEKVVDFILELAKVTENEVSVDELTREDDEDEKPKKESAAKAKKSGEGADKPKKKAAEKKPEDAGAKENTKAKSSGKKTEGAKKGGAAKKAG